MNESRHHPVPGRGRIQCLIVEDSSIILRNLTETLEQELDLDVAGSADAAQPAIAWLKQAANACDLVIIDVFLKQGTGLDVLAVASQIRPQAAKVVLTNYATPEIRSRCLALGAHRVFDKSSELEELMLYCSELASHLGAEHPTLPPH